MRNTAAHHVRAKTDEIGTTTPATPAKKVFNCITDESALIASVKRSTRDGVRKWVANGAIRLFVPLFTLEQLDRLKKGTDRNNQNAREAIKWLDDVTEAGSGFVMLQGVDEVYATWVDVEKYLMPDSILTAENGIVGIERATEDLESSLTLDDSTDGNSVSSSGVLEASPKTPSSPSSSFSAIDQDVTIGSPIKSEHSVGDEHSENSSTCKTPVPVSTSEEHTGTVPVFLRPLFNYIMWRTQHGAEDAVGRDSFIFLTNDPMKQKIASRFGIRVKRVEQMREAIVRESQDYKNRMQLYTKEAESEKAEKSTVKSVSDTEDEVVFKRPQRRPVSASEPLSGQRVWDPNDFGRAPPTAPSPRGGRGGRPGPRGGFHGRPMQNRQATPELKQPIDPDSYVRPSSRGMRGGRRQLWEPS